MISGNMGNGYAPSNDNVYILLFYELCELLSVVSMMTMTMTMTMTILNLIKCFDRDFECSISTFELGSRPSTDSGEGAQGDNILVLHVGARLPSQDKILQTDLAKV